VLVGIVAVVASQFILVLKIITLFQKYSLSQTTRQPNCQTANNQTTNIHNQYPNNQYYYIYFIYLSFSIIFRKFIKWLFGFMALWLFKYLYII
jgi:hypothetical protein